MLDSFATLLSTLGVAAGLGAAAGLRVFVPLFVASLACALGVITPGHGMEWIGSWWAVSAFGVLSLVEVVAFHVPWVDHALDALATPLAVISGTLVAAVPLLHALGASDANVSVGAIAGGLAHTGTATQQLLPWAAAVLGGGVPAAGVQLTSVATRASSTASTLGVANPIVATLESIGAAVVSALSVLVPLLIGAIALALFAAATVIVLYWARRRRSARARLAGVP